MLPDALAGELLFSGLLLPSRPPPVDAPAPAPAAAASGVSLLRVRFEADSGEGPFEGGAEADMGTLVGAIDWGGKCAGSVDVGAATAVDMICLYMARRTEQRHSLRGRQEF